MERYLCILNGMELDFEKAKIWIASAWIFSLLYGFYPFYTNSFSDILVLYPSRITCAYNWVSTSPFMIPPTVIALGTVFAVTSFVNYAYSKIVLFYFSRKKKQHGMTSKEWLLLKKSIIICCCQLFGWSLFFIQVLYEVVTGKSISNLFDGVSLVLAQANTVANALILFSYLSSSLGGTIFTNNIEISSKSPPHSEKTTLHVATKVLSRIK
ncbi:hypothetical protein HDV06_006581 [Boothiomyces sp. JEL0866]|nr:hypothetical protein HDV06_006581 [Boothiomyces sp. JEL0866]